MGTARCSASANRATSHDKSRAILFWMICILLALYVASYVILSLEGRFVPGAIGLNGVKRYVWRPRRFDEQTTAGRIAIWAFTPLFHLDHRYWHSPDLAYDNHYPVDQGYWLRGKPKDARQRPGGD